MRASLAAVRWALGASVCKLSDAAKYWQCWNVFFQHIFIRFLDRPCHALKNMNQFSPLPVYLVYFIYFSVLRTNGPYVPRSLDYTSLWVRSLKLQRKKPPMSNWRKGQQRKVQKRWFSEWFDVVMLGDSEWCCYDCCEWIWKESACHTRDFALIM